MKNIHIAVLLSEGMAYANDACFAQTNSFITDLYTADPSAHVWADGRLYVYL